MDSKMTKSEYGQFHSILLPRSRPQQAAALFDGLQNDWPPPDPEWRAEKAGRVKRPKARLDETRLRDFHMCCREGNHREVKMFGLHYPYLLSLTDRYGYSALHHAAMSGSPEMLKEVLDLYRNPKSFERRYVKYMSEEELCEDGLCLRPGTAGPDDECPLLVQQVAPRSLSALAGLAAGDVLKVIDGQRIMHDIYQVAHRVRLPTLGEIYNATEGTGRLNCHNFPMTLAFDRPAHVEILGQDTWRWMDSAGGLGTKFGKIRKMLIKEQRMLEKAAKGGSARAAGEKFRPEDGAVKGQGPAIMPVAKKAIPSYRMSALPSVRENETQPFQDAVVTMRTGMEDRYELPKLVASRSEPQLGRFGGSPMQELRLPALGP